ncbi:MAG: putative selenate ABC transporter substrate-binding protein [Microcoleaceae cyanobacterium]
MKNWIFVSGLLCLGLLLTSCTAQTAQVAPTVQTSEVINNQNEALIIGIVPNSDPQKQQRQSEKLVAYLESKLDIRVESRSISNTTEAINYFQLGDLELVWLDGLGGVKIRSKVAGADAFIQRDVDEQFHSVFIANKESELLPFNQISELDKLKGESIVFAGQYSISGRIMPQYFLQQAGVSLDEFNGKPSFSTTPDYTIRQVETGKYTVGTVDETIWQQKVNTNKINLDQVYVVWRTPAYSNYHWVIHPNVQQKYGKEFTDKLQQAFLNLNPNIPMEKEILDLFETGRFIPTNNQNYQAIEEISRELNLIP